MKVWTKQVVHVHPVDGEAGVYDGCDKGNYSPRLSPFRAPRPSLWDFLTPWS